MGNIDLADIAAGNGGFMFYGEHSGDRAQAPASIGDINGDGIADMLIGAAAPFNGGPTKAYVIFGGQSLAAQESLTNVGGSLAGFQIVVEYPNWNGGVFVPKGAGDFNGDGLNDIILSDRKDSEGGPGTGTAFVVFGKTDMESVNLADTPGSGAGVKIIGTLTNGAIGRAETQTGIGDVNHDGLDDVLVAASTDPWAPGRGEAYVVFGTRSTETIDLAEVKQGNGGFLIKAAPSTLGLGMTTAPVGDLNGDGYQDFALGTGTVSQGSDGAYVIFGHAGAWSTVDLDQVSRGIGGFKVILESPLDGWAQIAKAGDVNNDGIDDLVIGCNLNDAGGTDSGAAYVIFGNTSGLGAVKLAAIAAGQGGFKIIGENAGDRSGAKVDSIGDLNLDGFDDIMITTTHNGGRAGAAYVVNGKAGGAPVNLDHLANGIGGVKIVGYQAGSEAGFYAGVLGDVTNDGVADIALGAPYYRSEIGAVYVISGATLQSELAPRLVLSGGEGADTLDGGDGDDRMFAKAGDDAVFGGGGADVAYGGDGRDTLDGGAGNDLLYGNAGNDWMSGGDGKDTLSGGLGNDTLNGAAGTDAVGYGASGSAVIVDLAAGTADGEGHDRLSSIEEVFGSRFNDRITGDGGNNWFHGGLGDDTLIGGAGVDTASYVHAAGGVTVNLAAGIATGEGTDELSGIEAIDGSAFADTLIGDGGANLLAGRGGDDNLSGGDGRDTLSGGLGNDTLNGGNGDDTINGGGGADRLEGGAGRDSLTGGEGDDVFVFAPSSPAAGEIDHIADFTPGRDRIDLQAFGFADPAEALAQVTTEGDHIVLDLGAAGGPQVVIDHVSVLQADDLLI